MTPWKPGTSVTFNGKTYRSLEEMPPEVRRNYERVTEHVLADRDGNGVPDLLEGKADPGKNVMSVVTTTRRYVINGQEYERWEDVPPETRRRIEQAGGGPGHLPMPVLSRGMSGPDMLPRSRTRGEITIRLSWSTMAAIVVLVLLAVYFIWRAAN